MTGLDKSGKMNISLPDDSVFKWRHIFGVSGSFRIIRQFKRNINATMTSLLEYKKGCYKEI